MPKATMANPPKKMLSWNWYCEKDLLHNKFALYGVHPDAVAGTAHYLQTAVETIKDGEVGPGPSMSLSKSEALSLVNALCDAGIVPDKYAGKAPEPQSGELEAVKLHLDDMRKIALSFLENSK